MKFTPYRSRSSNRFVDLTPLPADISAQRETFRLWLAAAGLLVVGCFVALCTTIYGPAVSRFFDTTPLGLVWRIFL